MKETRTRKSAPILVRENAIDSHLKPRFTDRCNESAPERLINPAVNPNPERRRLMIDVDVALKRGELGSAPTSSDVEYVTSAITK